MRPYVWYSKATCVTGKRIKDELGIEGGRFVPTPSHNPIICYGARANKVTMNKYPYLKDKTYLNSIYKIEKNINKHNALIKMRDNNVSIPPMYNWDEFNELMFKMGGLNPLPVIARKSMHHGGSGLKIVDREFINVNGLLHSRDILKYYSYFLELINAEREYRVHVFQNQVIRITRKYLKEGLQEEELSKIQRVVKSHDNGWVHSLRDIEKVPETVKEEALKAVKALDYDFGGVDILYKDGKSYVLEVNSGCGLDNGSLDTYKKYLQKWLEQVE